MAGGCAGQNAGLEVPGGEFRGPGVRNEELGVGGCVGKELRIGARGRVLCGAERGFGGVRWRISGPGRAVENLGLGVRNGELGVGCVGKELGIGGSPRRRTWGRGLCGGRRRDWRFPMENSIGAGARGGESGMEPGMRNGELGVGGVRGGKNSGLGVCPWQRTQVRGLCGAERGIGGARWRLRVRGCAGQNSGREPGRGAPCRARTLQCVGTERPRGCGAVGWRASRARSHVGSVSTRARQRDGLGCWGSGTQSQGTVPARVRGVTARPRSSWDVVGPWGQTLGLCTHPGGGGGQPATTRLLRGN